MSHLQEECSDQPGAPAAAGGKRGRTACMTCLLNVAVAGHIPQNGIVGDPPGSMGTAMEGLGGVGTVDELLLQSHTGACETYSHS